MYSIYVITNTINGKKYIGMTSRSVRRRWRNHVSASKHENDGMYSSPLQADIREYGEDCFTHQVLVTTEDKELAMQLEDEITIMLNTHVPNGYNRIVGHRSVHTEDSKKKISEKAKGRTHSEETKRKMSENNSEKNNPFYGKHHTEETKKKISENTSEKLSKPVMCVETGVMFTNAEEASRWAGLKDRTGISRCCTGKQKTAGGYHWKYVKE